MARRKPHQLTGQPLIDYATKRGIPFKDAWDGRFYDEEKIRQRIHDARRAKQAAVALWIATLSALLAALLAALSAWNSYRAIETTRRSSQGTLLFDMTKTFFYQEPHKKIIQRLEERELLRKTISKSKPAITDEELDDHIGFLDTLGTFVRTGIIDLELADPLFGHYVESAFESDEIKRYVSEVRKSGVADYEDFEWLYNRVKAHGHHTKKPSK